jgi:hypothetical protein
MGGPKVMVVHRCYVATGSVGSVACMCQRGEDHDEAHYDLLPGDEPEEEAT